MIFCRHFLTALVAALASAILPHLVLAEEPSATDAAMTSRIEAMIPKLEAYSKVGMEVFDVPGLAIGIVVGDKLIYAKGFGVRSKSGGQPVDTRTIFQIGSNTKAFLAMSMAIMVDRGKLKWDDRVVDLYPNFQMKDPWVTREFRVFDLLAQRSGLPGLVNDMLAMLGLDEAALIRSLRYVDPISSFRTTFAYTNITHLLASRIVANAAGASGWTDVLQRDLLDPLGMKDSTWTVEAIEGAANHANGHRRTLEGTVEVPFTPIFPYHLAGAGNINSNIEDMARWVRLQLANGSFEGHQIVSPENLAVTRMARVALSDRLFYAMGWYSFETANGAIVWHDGDALSFGSFVGLAPSRNVGVIILTNETNVGFPSALGTWILDQMLGNPEVDYVATRTADVKAYLAAAAARFAPAANPRPVPLLAPLAGAFVSPSFGKAAVVVDGSALIMEILATGAKLKLEPWDGDVFVARLMPIGQFGPVNDLNYMNKGFVQFQITQSGQLDVLTMTLADGQRYEFHRE
jgi:CubicO group peptidase (beta-lactamase class C family)